METRATGEVFVIVLMNTGGIAATNCFLIADETIKQAVIFDAPDHTVAPLMDGTSSVCG
jgi:hypothetical protein